MKDENKNLVQDAKWIGKALAVYIPIVLVLTFLMMWGVFTLMGVPLW